MKIQVLFSLVFFSFFGLLNSLNILFYVNAIGKSHLDFCDSLIDSLKDRGHTVDLIVARLNGKVEGFGKSRADRKFGFGFQNDSAWTNLGHLVDPFKGWNYGYGDFRKFHMLGNDLCEIALTNKNLFDFISSRNYDIGLVSVYDYCGLGLFDHFNIASTATFSAIPLLPVETIQFGLPSPASVVTPLFQKNDLKTLRGKIMNLVNWASMVFLQMPEIHHGQSLIFEKHLGKKVDLNEIANRIGVAFVNSNEIIEKPRAISHKIQYIGGINLKQPKQLDENFDRILSISKNGTIIFSFGTQIPGSLFPRKVVKNFLNVFQKFNQFTFLWKYDVQIGEEQLFSAASNVFPLNWLPQNDLLHDKRVVAFISHVGLNSFNEASYAGVPILAIPLFADQPHNVENGVLRGTTYQLKSTELTEEKIEKGLKAILFDPSFRQNSQKIAKMLQQRPTSPRQRFVEWVEFAASNPEIHKVFQLPSVGMSIFEYYCVDILFLLFFSIFFTFLFLFKFSSFFISKIFKFKNGKKIKNA